jgi:hypothetical protein
LLLLLALEARAQGAPKIELLPAPKAPEDYEHQFKGCLENSECDQVMGHQLSRWNELVKKLKLPEMEEKERVRYLELFRAKYGIPVEFYTVQKSQQGFKPLLFNSSCREHNPKSGAKILRGTAFLKGLSHEKAVVWRDQTQIEVPIGELLTPQPVVAYRDAAIARYELPLGDQPLFIRNNHLYVLREADDLFYFLTVSEAGDGAPLRVGTEAHGGPVSEGRGGARAEALRNQLLQDRLGRGLKEERDREAAPGLRYLSVAVRSLVARPLQPDEVTSFR